MATVQSYKKQIEKCYKDKYMLEEALKKNQEVLNTLNKNLLETCIEKGTHKYVREYECLSYGDTEYRCKTCGLYK